jgi:hypothetical protein
LRIQLGRQISGQSVSLPLLPPDNVRPYGSYYINFQDPAGFPTNQPLVVNGHTWIKMGWGLFEESTNLMGWYVSQTNYLQYGWRATSSSNALQRSYVYDDFGQQQTFVFTLPNGVYDVEVGVGIPERVFPELVTVNGIDFFGNRPANVPEPVTNNAAATRRISVVNGLIMMEVGQQINGDINVLDYLGITAVSPSSPDGLDDLWQTLHFASATNSLAAPGVDADSDGAVNFLEFHFGTDPNSTASRPRLTATLPALERVQLEWSSATNHVFRVEQSSNLTAWSVVADQVLAINSTTRVILTRAVNAPHCFYRVSPVAP